MVQNSAFWDRIARQFGSAKLFTGELRERPYSGSIVAKDAT
jgi:hypothetical protein